MSSTSNDLPLDLPEPTREEQHRSRQTLLHCLVQADPAEGRLYGVDVATFSETEKALAFDWLWNELRQHRERQS